MLMSIQTIIIHNDKCQTIFHFISFISFIISQGRNNHKHNGNKQIEKHMKYMYMMKRSPT